MYTRQHKTRRPRTDDQDVAEKSIISRGPSVGSTGTGRAPRLGAILTTLGCKGGLLVVLDDGERFMKDHIDGAML